METKILRRSSACSQPPPCHGTGSANTKDHMLITS